MFNALQLQRKTQTINTGLAKHSLNLGLISLLKSIIKNYLQKFNVTELQLRDAVSEIERLNPKPGSSFSNNTRSIEHVVPDFTINIVEGELELSLNGRNAPELHVSQPYNEMLKGYKASKEKTKSQKKLFIYKTKVGCCEMVYRRYKTTSTNAFCHHEYHYALPKKLFFDW